MRADDLTRERWRRIERILDDLLDLPAGQRTAALERLCPANTELRDEVERLLGSCDREAGFLEWQAAALVAPLLGDLDPAGAGPGELREGETVGRYRVVRPLGRGGMGVVYLARDPELDRPVALKLLPSHRRPEPGARRRLLEEARAASALDHPHIETIYEIGTAEDGRLFVAMAYYEGETLAERVRRAPVPVGDAVEIATQVAEGLAAAHARGIVHRDIKPGNVMLTAGGAVKIVDFGIAKCRGREVTLDDPTPGTVAYMSPEQTRGEALDGRSDLWSLGVMLYEMLAGVRPFAADGEQAVIHQIRHDEPRPLRELRPEVSERVAAVVERLLRKSPDERFPDAGALLGSLSVILEPSAAAGGRRTRPAGRLGIRAIGLGIIVLVVVGLAALLRARANPILPETSGAAAGADLPASSSPIRVAVLPFAVRGEDRFAYLGEGMVELLSTQLDGAGPLRSVDPRALLAFLREAEGGEPRSPEDVDGRAVARRFGARLFVAGSVVEAGGRLRVQATLYDSAGRGHVDVSTEAGDEVELFSLVDRLARELIGSRYGDASERLTRLAAATTTSIPGLKAYLEGERALRAGRFDEALDAFRLAVARDSAFALAWYRLAVAAEWTIRPGVAETAAERAVELASALPEHDRLLVHAWHAYATGAATEAERLYRQILDGYPDEVEAWLQLAEVLFHYGPLEGRALAEARAPFERVLDFEPHHEGALLHLARIAARERRLVELARLADRLLAASPESEIGIEIRALRAFATDDSAAREAVIRELGSLDSDAIFTAVWTVSYTRDPDAVARLARLLTEAERPRDVRAAGHLLLATAELARGRWRRSREELASADSLNAAWARELGALHATSGIAPIGAAEVDSLRAILEGWDAAATPAPPGSGAFLTAHDGAHHRLRSYLIGLLAAARGEREAVAALAADLARPDGPARADTLASNLARGLRAEVLGRTGRPREALNELEKGRTHSPYGLAVASPFHAASRERFLKAGLLIELGQDEEGLRFYETLGDGSVYDLPFMAPAHLRAAAVLERLGQRERAAEHYRRFTELWRDADPELRPAVEEARRKAAAVTGGAGGL